jgi:hypothetical protein
MKKRLLFAFMAMFAAVSGYALEQGEFVYTPQGRFQITGANLNANNAFQDMTGWTAVSAAEKTLTDLFNINANGLAEGFNSVASLDATEGEGMYYQFVPSDASSAYVVSYKLKGAAAVSIRVKTVAVSTNLVKVEGNSDNAFGGTNDVLVANTAEELTDDWQTFNYAIVGDGTTRTYFISFTGMATNIEIADLQIAPALQFADLRQRDAMLEKLNVYKNCYDWKAGVLDEYAMNEAIENLQAIGDESGQADLDEALVTAQEILDEFLKANMDDYLAGGSNLDYLPNNVAKQASKQSSYGIWSCLPAGRAHWDANAYPDMGHFQNSNTWNNGAPDTPMGVYTQKQLEAGSYVFSISASAALREPKKNDWNNDDGLNPAYAIAYIVKINDGADPDTIVSVTKNLDAVTMTPFYLTAKIEEAATYELGIKAYCKEECKTLKNGSVTYVGNASLFVKNENKYNQKQLNYEADVREQITTGRDALTKAAEYLANADNLWGRADLQDSITVTEPKIAVYETMTQDEIIATFDEAAYVKDNRTKNAEEGLLVFQVYDSAVKGILAANKKFLAVNDTLNSIQTVIDAAENTLVLRIYDSATGKDALKDAINTAKGIQSQMKAAQYSEENAATIVDANKVLTAAIETFKTTIPESSIATIVDIDFEADAVLNEDTQLYSIAGANGAMEFSNFALDVNDNYPYQQGIWNNGEQQFKGYVRVGNGTGTVNFDPTIDGSMGTNILKLNCDFFLQGLSGKYVGFYLKNDADSIIAGHYANYYDNKIDASSNLNIDLTNLQYGSGSGYANKAPEGAEGAEGTVLPKNSFEVILDFGEGSIYTTTTSAKGVVTTAKQAFDKTAPTKFVLQSNYINNDRRIWFDNLKIQRILAGEVTGIQNVKAGVNTADGAIYNLAGQKVSKSFKGLVIKNGKKFIVK